MLGSTYASSSVAHERTHNGCFTCRLRGKKCDVNIPVEQNIERAPCPNCQRLGIECMGYGKDYPSWMQDRIGLKQNIKERLTLTGHIKGRNMPRSASGAVRCMTDGILRLSPSHITTPSFPGPGTTSTMNYPKEDPQILALTSRFDRISLSMPNDQQTFANIEFQSSQSMLGTDAVFYPEQHPYENTATMHHDNNLATWRVYPDPKSFLLEVYYQHVFSRAYMLVHPSMVNSIASVIDTDIFAQNSICLLASTFLMQTGQEVPISYRQNMVEYFFAYEPFLMSSNRRISRGEAWGALQLISNSLFADGAHPWQHYLKIAFTYVHPLICDTPVCDLDPSTLFIAQITGWFCVLAAISNDFRPDYLMTFIALFEVGNYAKDHARRYMNMSAIMGADCRVLWALAETTDLAQTWHALSSERIQQRGYKILQRLRESGVAKPEDGADPTSIHNQRWATGELFRLSALLYYYAVINDNNPCHPDISICVDKMIELILTIGSSHITSRMCVFGIFLCGALCKFDQIPILAFFLSQASTDNVGNSRAVLALLLEIWQERAQRPCCSNVNWRGPLKKEQLLLV